MPARTGCRMVWSVKRTTVPYAREGPLPVRGNEATVKKRVREPSEWVMASGRRGDPGSSSPEDGRDRRVNGDRRSRPCPHHVGPWGGEQGHPGVWPGCSCHRTAGVAPGDPQPLRRPRPCVHGDGRTANPSCACRCSRPSGPCCRSRSRPRGHRRGGGTRQKPRSGGLRG